MISLSLQVFSYRLLDLKLFEMVYDSLLGDDYML